VEQCCFELRSGYLVQESIENSPEEVLLAVPIVEIVWACQVSKEEAPQVEAQGCQVHILNVQAVPAEA
jgi:hypothetical protein